MAFSAHTQAKKLFTIGVGNDKMETKNKKESIAMIRAKAVSSLEKIMLTNKLDDFAQVSVLPAARGERVSFQIIAEDPVEPGVKRAMGLRISLRSKLSGCIKGFHVGQVPAQMPVYVERDSGE